MAGHRIPLRPPAAARCPTTFPFRIVLQAWPAMASHGQADLIVRLMAQPGAAGAARHNVLSLALAGPGALARGGAGPAGGSPPAVLQAGVLG